MQTTNTYRCDAFCQYGILNTYMLGDKSDDQTAQGLHSKKSHCINANNPAAHSRINCCLYQRVTDGDLAHHAKCPDSSEYQGERIECGVGKQSDSKSKNKSVDRKNFPQMGSGF